MVYRCGDGVPRSRLADRCAIDDQSDRVQHLWNETCMTGLQQPCVVSCPARRSSEAFGPQPKVIAVIARFLLHPNLWKV